MLLPTYYDYYAEDKYMSVSQFKRYEKCEKLGGVPFGAPTDSMLVGSYVDAYVEGTLDKFKEENPQIISSRGPTKGQLKSTFKIALDICDYIDGNHRIQQYLSGQKQIMMAGEIEGVPFKIKMDSYLEDKAIVDLKVMYKITNKDGEFIDFITPWGYDLQLACYQEIVRQETGKQLPCYIVAVEKSDPINSVIVQIPQIDLDKALYRVSSILPHLYDVKMGRTEPCGCGKCEVCIAEREVTPILTLDELV